MEVRESDSAGSERVDVRRFVLRAAVTAKIPITDIVGEKNDYVGRRGRRRERETTADHRCGKKRPEYLESSAQRVGQFPPGISFKTNRDGSITTCWICCRCQV